MSLERNLLTLKKYNQIKNLVIFTTKFWLISVRKMTDLVEIATLFLVFFYAIVVGNVAKVYSNRYFIGIFLTFN